MKSIAVVGLGVLLMSGFASEARAEAMYIRTVVQITLRTGPGTDHKITRMIRSGQEVDLIEKGEKWSKIRVSSGQVGWVMTNLLTAEKPQLYLPSSSSPNGSGEQGCGNLIDDNRSLREENLRLSEELSDRQKALETLEEAYEPFQDGAGAYGALKSKYESALQQLNSQSEKAAQLEETVEDFQRQHNIRLILTGAAILLAGFFIGSREKRQRRRSSILR